jgi:hypothetical protein
LFQAGRDQIGMIAAWLVIVGDDDDAGLIEVLEHLFVAPFTGTTSIA